MESLKYQTQQTSHELMSDFLIKTPCVTRGQLSKSWWKPNVFSETGDRLDLRAATDCCDMQRSPLTGLHGGENHLAM